MSFDGREIEIDAATLTFGEQRKVNKAIREMAEDEEDAQVLATPAFVWVILQRTEPDITLDEVVDGLTIGDAMSLGGTLELDDPEA